MSRISLKAFLLSNLLDIALTLGAAITLVLFVLLTGNTHALTHAQRQTRFIAAIHSSTFRAASLLISIIISSVAGFVGGMLANQSRILNGLLSISLHFLYSAWQLAHPRPGNLVVQLAILVILPAFALVGARLAELESSCHPDQPILPAPPDLRRPIL